MNLGIIAHNSKKVLIEDFCIAYKNILAKHEVYATGTTGRRIEEATSLHVHKFLAGSIGGDKQFMEMVERQDLDMVILFYNPVMMDPVATDGVMAWDGSLPVKISGGLDNTWLMNVRGAVGGVLDTRYYLHLRVPGRNETRLLVYDTERQLWHEEDTAAEENASGWAMCSTGRQLYQWDGVNLWATEPEREADRDTDAAKANLEQKVGFEAVSGDIGLNIPADKYINRVFLRVDALTYSVVELQASYEGGAWETLGQAAVLNKYTRVNLPFVPERHDTMRLRIKGTGQIAVRSIAFSMAESRGNRVAGGEPKR